MKDIIQQIMNQENLDEIYGYAQNALFKDGPVSITTLEILSYLKLFAPDYFSAVEEEILSIMGIFYKKPTARTLQSKLFELYSEHIRQTYHHDYTPVQANILKQIQANQHFSFSAPTSTGKSHAKINADYDSKLHLYESLCDLYRYYLNGRTLSEGEESVLNTAIKILLWKIHCKTFKAICWYRYAYVARIPERRAFAKKYRAAKSQTNAKGFGQPQLRFPQSLLEAMMTFQIKVCQIIASTNAEPKPRM